MRRTLAVLVLLALCVAAGVAMWPRWREREQRSIAIHALERFDVALRDASLTGLLEQIVLPVAVASRAPAEQSEFLRKALTDEISPEGIAVLARDGTYGPLTNVFPETGFRWAAQAGVNPSDCVAFRMERNGIVAEVVLVTNPPPQKVVRCNNVKQMVQ